MLIFFIIIIQKVSKKKIQSILTVCKRLGWTNNKEKDGNIYTSLLLPILILKFILLDLFAQTLIFPNVWVRRPVFCVYCLYYLIFNSGIKICAYAAVNCFHKCFIHFTSCNIFESDDFFLIYNMRID